MIRREPTQAAPRLFCGTPPKDGILVNGWPGWQVYLRTNEDPYSESYKLIRVDPSPKANYWLLWKPDDKQFLPSNDLVTLAARNPVDYCRLIDFLIQRGHP